MIKSFPSINIYEQEYNDFRKSHPFIKADLATFNEQELVSSADFKKNVLKQLSFRTSDMDDFSDKSSLHYLFQVKKNDRKFFLKVNKYPQIFHELNLSHELLLHELKINIFSLIPRTFELDLSRTLASSDYVYLEDIEGKTLKEMLPKRRTNKMVFKELGRITKKLHKQKCNGFGPIDIKKSSQQNALFGIFKTWREVILSNIEPHIEYCKKIGAINKSQAEDIRKIFKKFDSILDNSNSCLLHADLGSHNIIVNKGKITAILDWEDAFLGDPIFDVASFASFYALYNKENVDYFLEGYGLDKENKKNFDRKFWLYSLRIAIIRTITRSIFLNNQASNMADNRIDQALSKLSNL